MVFALAGLSTITKFFGMLLYMFSANDLKMQTLSNRAG